MALPNARNQYLKTQIETASKEQLIVMLFDGIIRFTEQARKAINENEIEESHHSLMRAQAIIMELICTVDKEKGGDIANNLMSLHAYAFNCLIKCNMHKDVAHIDEVQKIYRELRKAWVGAMDSLGIGATEKDGEPLQPNQPTPPRNGPGAPVPSESASAAPAGGIAAPSQPHGLMAAAAPATEAIAEAPAAPAPAPANKLGVYGMGRTAMLGAMPKQPAAAAAPAPAITASPATAKQAAVLNAYGAGSRSA